MDKDKLEDENMNIVAYANLQNRTKEVNVRPNGEYQSIVKWTKEETSATSQGDIFPRPLQIECVDGTHISEQEELLALANCEQANKAHGNQQRALSTPADTSSYEKLQLWNAIYSINQSIVYPWLVGGDFNVILSPEEKIGGLPVYPSEVEDFAFCTNSCELVDIRLNGSPFTWWNGRADDECIFKRLDKIFVNNLFLGEMGNVKLDILARSGSDHAPMLLTCGGQVPHLYKPFRFLKFWTEKEEFKEVVQQNWVADGTSDVFVNLKLKMKRTRQALRKWSRECYGDIFQQLIIREDIVRVKEQLFEQTPSTVNREVLSRAQAEYNKYLHFEEEFWRHVTTQA
ncbi:hypothetical protein KY284_026718 [Solanum tuberosum]|nr:hypothetical protein KY284_026718 [Solanum tuberosum]